MAKAAAEAPPAGASSPLQKLKNLPQWVRTHRVQSALVFSVILSIFGGLLFAWALKQAESQQRERERNYTGDDALAAVLEDDLPKALHIAQCVERSGNFGQAGSGAPAYVYGLAAARRAETPLESQRRHSFRVAAYWFGESNQAGFPASRESEGYYYYGKSLFFCDRYAEAVEPLLRALEFHPQFVPEVRRYLALSYFLQTKSDLPSALKHIEDSLRDLAESADERAAALVVHAELLLKADRADEARRDLAQVPLSHPLYAEAEVIAARLDLAAAQRLRPPAGADKQASAAADAERNKLYRSALAALERAQRSDRLSVNVTPKALYVRGLFDLEMENVDEAADAFHKAYRRAVDLPEGLAARMESGRIAQIRDKVDEAVRLYREILGELGDLHTYSNRWWPLNDLRTRLIDVYHEFLAGKHFEAAAQLAEGLPKIVEEDEAVQLAAEAYEAWGRAEGPVGVAGATYERLLPPQARAHFRKAAEMRERLAQLRFATRDYPEQIWSSARQYALGRDYDRAARQYRKYLEIEPRSHHSQALVGLAEVMITKEYYDEALALLKDCIELHPGDPAINRARLLLAQLYVEMNRFPEAEQALTENLESDALTPDGEEWRRSLFALGRLYYELGRYAEAAARLDEAYRRYPDDPETAETLYRAAEAHRRSAQRVERATPADALPAERAEFARRAAAEYEEALVRYDDLVKTVRTPDVRAFEEISRVSMLRNAVFARGNILFALGRYAEAVQAYQNAVSSFPQSPAALDAYLQIAACYRRLNKGAEMRGTLEQAKLMLQRLPQDAAFDEVTNFNREEWLRILEAAATL